MVPIPPLANAAYCRLNNRLCVYGDVFPAAVISLILDME